MKEEITYIYSELHDEKGKRMEDCIVIERDDGKPIENEGRIPMDIFQDYTMKRMMSGDVEEIYINNSILFEKSEDKTKIYVIASKEYQKNKRYKKELKKQPSSEVVTKEKKQTFFKQLFSKIIE